MQKIVIIPTYNERENIQDIIRTVFQIEQGFHILVVDDNSPDGTAYLVKQLQTEFPNELFLLQREKKNGLGRAYIAGFEWSLQHQYDYIFEMDADFSHNPNDLQKLYEACVQGADLSVGSRYITGVNVVNWPLSRVLLSYIASMYVRWITGMEVMDTTAGFVCYKRSTLEKINLKKVQFIGYAFQIEMKYRTYAKDLTIKEIPIIFTDRTKGQSKMSAGIIKEAIFGVLKLRIKKLFNRL